MERIPEVIGIRLQRYAHLHSCAHAPAQVERVMEAVPVWRARDMDNRMAAGCSAHVKRAFDWRKYNRYVYRQMRWFCLIDEAQNALHRDWPARDVQRHAEAIRGCEINYLRFRSGSCRNTAAQDFRVNRLCAEYP